MSRIECTISFVIILQYFFLEIQSKAINNSYFNSNLLINNDTNLLSKHIKITSIPLITSNKNENHPFFTQNSSRPRPRIGKFFASLPFLTGLGVGTLATSSAIATSSALQSNDYLPSTRFPRPVGAAFTDSSTDFNQGAPISQKIILPASSHHSLSIYDSSYPYVALSTTLLDQSLRSIYNMLENLKSQLARNDSLHIPSTTEHLITYDNINTDTMQDEVTQSEETAKVEVINKRDNRMDVINCSILKDVIRESIKEANADLEKRQVQQATTANPVNATTGTPIVTTTTEKMTTTSAMPTSSETSTSPTANTTSSPQINTTEPFAGYYGGQPQNINGINLLHSNYPGIPATSYELPNDVYGSPFVAPHEFYHQPYYHHPHDEHYEYGMDNSFSPNFGYPEIPIYPPLARSRKYSKDIKSVNRKNDFVPTKILKQG